MIKYSDPDENGNEVIHYVSEEEAIRRSKLYATKKGYVYKNDEEALIDFIVVHWAERI